jgi:hypothetical protein
MRPMLSTAVFLLIASGVARAAAVAQGPVAGNAPPAKAEGEIAASVRVLLDASAGLGALLERTEGFKKLPQLPAGTDPWEHMGKLMDESRPLEYPTHLPEAIGARRVLLQHGSHSVPFVLEELRTCDLKSYSEVARAHFGMQLLEELTGGSFGSGLGVDPERVAAMRKALASWGELWRQTSADRAFWTLSYGLDRPKAPRAVEGTDLPFVDFELVMPPGTRIRVGSADEAIEITADRGFGRTYTWKGASRSVRMMPRMERWLGSLGLYFPGPGNHWEEHDGISRGVLEEGQRHFATTEKALAWIKQPRRWQRIAYRNDGLAVTWGRDPMTLYVEVWQIVIDGKRPTELPGSDDAAIVVAR